MKNLSAEKNLANSVSARSIDGMTLGDLWNSTASIPIYRVIDEEGVNVAGACIKRLTEEIWMYVDDTDGYDLLGNSDVERLILVPDSLHIPCGWDKQGNVITL